MVVRLTDRGRSADVFASVCLLDVGLHFLDMRQFALRTRRNATFNR